MECRFPRCGSVRETAPEKDADEKGATAMEAPDTDTYPAPASAGPIVIGMGASAGGLEALQSFFADMPGNSGAAFVVVQHLSPDYKSLMAEILGKHTGMTVIQAEEDMPVEPDAVYLIPPGHNLTFRKGRLHLMPHAHSGLNHPIDIFFESLAAEMKERAVAVIFSGTGSDGTNGVKSIKEHGGLVIVQSPETARFDGMPRSAINTGLADFVLSPAAIAEEILNICKFPAVTFRDEAAARACSDEESLFRIYTQLKKISGIDFTYYKRTTVLRRIERRMVVTHCASLGELAARIMEKPAEADALAKDILIGVTRFFRDPEFFEKLKVAAIRSIVKGAGSADAIRIWCAGCSTGEEAYSIGILLHEAMEEAQLTRNVKIFATDVDAKAIETAGKGLFSENIVDDVSPERLGKYFCKRNDQYQISKDIRQMIIFAPHNMFSDPPFGRLDLICCRNVLIYFQPVLQKSMFAIFHSALKNGGYLFLGKSETASEYSKIFKPASIAEKIYIHRGEGKSGELMPPVFTVPALKPSSPSAAPAPAPASEDNDCMGKSTYLQFLEKFLLASVVIDARDTVTHFFGNYWDYLRIAPGKATFNFFSIVNEDLRLVTSTAINRCRAEHAAVTYTGISVDTPSGRRILSLRTQPLTPHEDSGPVAVLFLENTPPDSEGITEKYDINMTAARRIADLEHELQKSRSDLKASISNLETVNEELQAANEELLTANEELQSSNEELQSVNEELYTVNSEYQQKLDELRLMTNDLSNFLSSTMIGILFVDGKLNIRKFTEYIGREFQLMEHDIGRPIQIFAHSFPSEDIVSDADTVLQELIPIDREVVGLNGRFYTMRIAPYRTTDNSIRGLVITVIDSLGTSRTA